MDMALLNEHFAALNRGREILIPHYDFTRKMRDTSAAPACAWGRTR